MKPLSLLVIVSSALLAGLLQGCASSSSPRAGAPLREPHTLPLFRADGAAADFNALASACANADAVLIGEVHGHEQGLDFAAALWEGILSRTDRAALSMEFFERDQQAALDDYLQGVTDEPAFRKAAGRTEGGYPAGHRRMVEAAKGAGRPVVAANAPRRYTRVARTEGYERLAGLSSEQRRLFDLPDGMPPTAYHDAFMKLMGGMEGGAPHGDTKAAAPDPKEAEEQQRTVEGFYRAQVLWDSTMAASIDRALAQGLAPVVHIVGRFHVENGGGTFQLLRMKRPEASIVTIIIAEADGPSLRSADQGKADYIVYVGGPPAE